MNIWMQMNMRKHFSIYRVRTINLGSFWVNLLSKQLIIEMFVGTHWKAVYPRYELMLTNCFYSQKQVGKGSNLCRCAKSSAHQKKTSKSKSHHFLIWWKKFLIRIKRQKARTTDIIVLTLRMPLLLCTTKTGWRPAWWTTSWRECMWSPSSPDYNPLDYFMWSEFENEVSKQPHNILASLKAKISEVMTIMDR